MTRHSNERSVVCPQSMHPGSSSRVNSSSEPSSTELAPSPSATCTGSSTIKVNAGGSVGCTTGSATGTILSPSASSISSSWDSRIPRPSPTGLRRSASMRVRGERISPHQPPPPPSTAATAAQVRHQHQQRRRLNFLQHQQHHHPDHRTFPVITENGTESPRQRSLSLSLTPARPRSGHAASGGSSLGIADDSDAESVKSYGSACSTASACDHATFAFNGTTWSGRSRKYVVHCSNHNGDNEQYLTPTQRAARQIRKFQALLKEARKEIEEKDQEIFRLTKEVVELRLYKASLNSPDERTDSSDALTVRENNPFSPESPTKDLPDEGTLQKVTSPDTPEKRAPSDLPSSLADSGHFEDGSIHSKDSVYLPEVQPETINSTTTPDKVTEDSATDAYTSTVAETPERDEERRKLVNLYESRIEEMHRRHVDELQELKQKHNDKVESLLNQLAEVNTRYCEVRPCVDTAEARARELEAELEAVKAELTEKKTLLSEQEERNKQMYLKMYAKGQEAARLEQCDQILEHPQQTTPKVTVAELLRQLTITQAELENIKDTSYSPEPHISADRSPCLLSAQEAVSLWVLGTRKAMYRRFVEARSNQGALDPEITLQFLRSAIYYFLTDKENHQGHLNAIESILGFTDAEKHNIEKLYRSARK
ncbi:GRIP domain-containing protein quick-to-court isoform X1 [Calliopsis andreniformis]|uniref:GRIP domain-containing protein quick-to-court isoform X1 n=1 Tax=Calliopsis andreniformis TaxID=337506 RepID=UPI003FCC3D0D